MIEIASAQSGRVAVIVPHGVLFRGGAEGKIRQALIEENLLDAVVGLPANLFTTTGIPVAILVFDRSREQGGANESAARCPVHRRQQGVHAGQDPERDGRGAHREGAGNLSPRGPEIDKYSHRASPGGDHRERLQPQYPPLRRYLRAGRGDRRRRAAEEINTIEAELAEVRGRMAGYLKELGVDV